MPGNFGRGEKSRENCPSTLSGALRSTTRPRRDGFSVIVAALLSTVHVRASDTVAARGGRNPAYVEGPLHLHAVSYSREGSQNFLWFCSLVVLLRISTTEPLPTAVAENVRIFRVGETLGVRARRPPGYDIFQLRLLQKSLNPFHCSRWRARLGRLRAVRPTECTQKHQLSVPSSCTGCVWQNRRRQFACSALTRS